MRVGLDATPLIGQRTGVGRYLQGLLLGIGELEPDDLELVLTVFSARGRVPAMSVPRGTRRARLKAPARLLHQAWTRSNHPPVELLTGRLDVFHAGNFVLPPTRRAAGVVTVHDLAFLHHPETLAPAVAHYGRLVPRSVARAERVVTVSQAVAAELVSLLGVDPARIVVAPHGVDDAWRAATPADAATLSRLGLPARYVLFVGNAEPRKNLVTLLEAHEQARRQEPGVPPLVIAGPAGWGERFGGWVPDPRHVVRAGFLRDDDLRGVVAGAVALCMPSVYEGFGLPILEACAAGTRVLASDVPAHAELLGKADVLGPTDVDAWAAGLVAAGAVSEDDTDRLARQEVAAPYTWARSASTHLACYRAAAETR